MRKSTPCDLSLAEFYLDLRLQGIKQEVFEKHLDSCPECCDRLQALAADDELWREAPEYLVDDELDSECGVLLSGEFGHDGSGNPAGAKDFSLQQIVNFLSPTDDPAMLGRFGGYEIVGVIGRGGMGVVLKGFESCLNRYVAIKVLSPHLAASGAARKRFSREAQAAAAVIHENVMAIHRVSEAAGLPYLVMPYVAGCSLQKRLDDEGPLQTAETLRIAMQVAKGLAAAHAQGLVHRDIKPANILLETGVERVTITDFGLARAADDASLTRSGVIAGTPQFMSPEQAQGEVVGPKSDLFSLGSVMYAMCTGRVPFRADTALGVLRRITDSIPRPIRDLSPEAPVWLCEIVERLLAKEPDERFESAAEVSDLLERFLAHVQQPSVSPAPVYLDRSSVRQHGRSNWGKGASPAKGLLVVAAACLLLLVIAGVWTARRFGTVERRSDKRDAGSISENGVSVPEAGVEAMNNVLSAEEWPWSERVQDVESDVTRVEQSWFGSGQTAVEPFDESVLELNRQLDSVGERIESGAP